MTSQNPDDIPSSEITSEEVFLNRRNFMRAGVLVASALATGLVYRRLNSPKHLVAGNAQAVIPNVAPPTEAQVAVATNISEAKTPLESIVNYNNFYEFSTSKEAVAEAASHFVSRPWTVSVGGLCSKPTEFDLDDLLKIAPPQERVYRMRCVEGWSMVIPWDGFELSKLLDRVQPLASAKYVAFTTLFDPKRMPNQSGPVLNWPYVEGLRIDEAMHPLTILASGLYGRELPPQDGAPIRLVAPWKYGFKGIKSIVKITLTEKQPPTTWSLFAPEEYGFYANVNPNVDHPRWSQAHENRIGEMRDRPTLMFNGYAEQVAAMYTGMDLHQYF
ncbi:MAG: protein-methionine-sulfoxide reductase catalytic subunit MsrP [Planctomycetota bacterium]|nr:protein-methionine-sulfoxide reductase catalytic subunit MsrP [Planctomycetota bacterium]